MLVVINNESYRQWSVGHKVEPLGYCGDLIIAIDPSKTNMACILGTPNGQILRHVEFSGNNRKKGPVMDTSDYCNEVRAYLRELLHGCCLYMSGIEAPITKKGMEHHHSAMVLKEIHGIMMNLFIEEFRAKPIAINNWSWKSAMLPDGYRSPYAKGSKLYFQRHNPESPYNFYFEADMTDVYFIYYYMVNHLCKDYHMICNRTEEKMFDYNYLLRGFNEEIKMPECQYNHMYTFEDNLVYYTNRLLQPVKMRVPVCCLTVNTIYEHTYMFDDPVYPYQDVWLILCRA